MGNRRSTPWLAGAGAIVALAAGVVGFLANLGGAREFVCSVGATALCVTTSDPQQYALHRAPSPLVWSAMTNASEYARNYERREVRPFEKFNQVVTIFELPMTDDRREGIEVAPGEYVEMFKVYGRDDDVVVQIRIDKQGYWVMSRQSLLLTKDQALSKRNPEKDAESWHLFQLALQDRIDQTRHTLRTEF